MKPGLKTSELYLTALAIILTDLLGSGLLVPVPTIATTVSLVVSVLAALGYTAARTSLKKAQIAADTVKIDLGPVTDEIVNGGKS